MQPFIGLDDLSDILGEDVSTSDVAVIAIDASCQAIRDYLGHDINLATDEEITLDGKGRQRLVLPEAPVWEVSEVIENGVTLDPADYTLDDGRQITGMYLRKVGVTTVPSLINNYYGSTYPTWYIGVGNIAVTYTHGWDVTEPPTYERVPSSIRRVALSLAKRIYQNSGSTASTGATTSLKIGTATETYDVGAAIALSSTELLDSEMRSIASYKALAFS